MRQRAFGPTDGWGGRTPLKIRNDEAQLTRNDYTMRVERETFGLIPVLSPA